MTALTQPNIRLTVPFFMVKDMEASLRFYTEGLQFKLTNQWTPRGKIEWCRLQRDEAAIMLQQPRSAAHQLYTSGQKPGLNVSICYQCVDALALYHEFLERGLPVSEPFVGNNLWVFHVKDPDGYNLDFESPTDVPEETKYSEWVKKE